MKNINELEKLTEKELRKLRMNLNNRIEAYKNSEAPKELQKSHVLYGLSRGACEALLLKVTQAQKLLKQK